MRTKASVPVLNLRNVYGTTPVTTAAYVELSPSLPANLKELEIFDTSQSVLQLAIGPSGSEVDLPFMVLPGGNVPSRVNCLLNAGMRLSIKAVDQNATSGQLIINGYA